MSEIKYTGKNALIYLLTLIKNNFVQKDGNKVLSDNNLTDELLSKIQNSYAPEISTNVAADAQSDTKTVSPKAVVTYVTDAISNIQGIEYKILSNGEYADGVPTVSGEVGIIYLLPISGSNNNIYEEFIYDGTKFEKIGTTEVNLDGYVLETDLVEITNTEIDEIYNTIA